MYRLYRITVNADGTETPARDDYEDAITAEGNFEFQKGLAMEGRKTAFIMLLDGNGEIHHADSIQCIAMIGDGTIKPRLFEVKTTDKETPNSYVHETAYDVSADYYKRLGGAKQNAQVRAEMLRGVDERGNKLEYTYWVRPIEPTE